MNRWLTIENGFIGALIFSMPINMVYHFLNVQDLQLVPDLQIIENCIFYNLNINRLYI